MPTRMPTKTKEAITEKTQGIRKQTVSLTNRTSPVMRQFPSWWRVTEGLCILQSCCSSMSLPSDYVQLSIYIWLNKSGSKTLLSSRGRASSSYRGFCGRHLKRTSLCRTRMPNWRASMWSCSRNKRHSKRIILSLSHSLINISQKTRKTPVQDCLNYQGSIRCKNCKKSQNKKRASFVRECNN